MTTAVREVREELIRKHMGAENVQDFDLMLTTMQNPRTELIPTGEVFEGGAAVKAYQERTRVGFPDQQTQNIRMHHCDDLVVVECDLVGTHSGPLFGIAPTGKPFKVPLVAFFFFDGSDGDRIILERIYFDTLTILTQLGLTPGLSAPQEQS